MSPLPSSIARYDSVDLLDLDELPYVCVRRPVDATLRAWDKAEEAERRWAMFDWATFVITSPTRNVRLMQDLSSAYLMSFEATIQILKDEGRCDGSEDWLKAREAYNLTVRGLRCLRNLDAHIRTGRLVNRSDRQTASRFANVMIGGTITWQWPKITDETFASLRSPKLGSTELAAFNSVVEEQSALEVMRAALMSLHEILLAAEKSGAS